MMSKLFQKIGELQKGRIKCFEMGRRFRGEMQKEGRIVLS